MTPTTVLCLYRVREGEVDAFASLLATHWPTLHSAGLVTDDPARCWRSADREGRPVMVERFTWKDASMAARAHERPDVLAVWEPMGALCEDRPGASSMEFLDLEPIGAADGA
ncbi:MAG: hypothetical protein ACF8XB_13685 [Planctomycetota bacterium JB042]